MEVHRRGCGGRSDAKAALFSTLGNILESWRKPSLPLLYSRLLSTRAFLISIVVDVPPLLLRERPPLLLPQPQFQPLRLSLHAQNGDVAITLDSAGSDLRSSWTWRACSYRSIQTGATKSISRRRSVFEVIGRKWEKVIFPFFDSRLN